MPARWILVGAALVGSFDIISATPLLAPQAACAAEAIEAPARFDTAFVHPGFASAVAIHPRRILNSKFVTAFPPEFIQHELDEFDKSVHLNLRNVDRMMFLIGPPTPENEKTLGYTVGIVFRFNEPLEPEATARKAMANVTPAVYEGKKYFRGGVQFPEGMYFPDSRTLVYAPEKTLLAMMSAAGQASPLVELLAAADPNHDAVAVGTMGTVRESLKKAADKHRDNLGPRWEAIALIPDRLKTFQTILDLDSDELSRVTLNTEDEAAAADLEKGAAAGVDLLGAIFGSFRDATEKSLVPQAVEPVMKLYDGLSKGMKVARDGRRVVLTFASPPGWRELGPALKPVIKQ